MGGVQDGQNIDYIILEWPLKKSKVCKIKVQGSEVTKKVQCIFDSMTLLMTTKAVTKPRLVNLK